MMNARDFIDSVSTLRLPSEEYIVIGSGVLCALAIREAADVELVVSENVFNQTKERNHWVYISEHMGEQLSMDFKN
jgi:hypothetical protein